MSAEIDPKQMNKFVKKFVSILAEDFGVPPPRAMYINIECIDLGAYNLSNKIIKIFKGGDAYTITHEFSHYLQDVLFKKSDRERYAKDLDYRELIEDEAFEIGDMIGFVYKDLIPKIKECKEIPPVSERRARLCKELAEYIHEYAYRVTWILEREHLDRAKEFLNHIEYSMKEIAKKCRNLHNKTGSSAYSMQRQICDAYIASGRESI
jgi:hypothetical protein